MTSRGPRTLSLALVVLIPAGAGCGARSALPSESTEGSWTCEDGSRAGEVGCGTLTFAEPVHLASGAGESGQVVIADLDGDSALDIAVSGHDGAVAVLLNKGAGSFSDAVLYSTSLKGIGRLAAGDLNGDGIDDLVATPAADASDSVGHLDLVVERIATPGAGVSLFLGAGGGAFTGPISYPYTGRLLGATDISGDGRPDLLQDDSSGVSVRLNAGEATFGDALTYPLAESRGTFSLAVADLNGDCRPDLAAVSEDDLVRVLPNLGQGDFGPRDAHAVKGASYSIAAGDLDDDGAPDLAVAYIASDVVTVLLNRGCAP